MFYLLRHKVFLGDALRGRIDGLSVNADARFACGAHRGPPIEQGCFLCEEVVHDVHLPGGDSRGLSPALLAGNIKLEGSVHTQQTLLIGVFLSKCVHRIN